MAVRTPFEATRLEPLAVHRSPEFAVRYRLRALPERECVLVHWDLEPDVSERRSTIDRLVQRQASEIHRERIARIDAYLHGIPALRTAHRRPVRRTASDPRRATIRRDVD